MEIGIASVAAITVVCYLVGLIVKASCVNDRYIPIACWGWPGCIWGCPTSPPTTRSPLWRWVSSPALPPPASTRRQSSWGSDPVTEKQEHSFTTDGIRVRGRLFL